MLLKEIFFLHYMIVCVKEYGAKILQQDRLEESEGPSTNICMPNLFPNLKLRFFVMLSVTATLRCNLIREK